MERVLKRIRRRFCSRLKPGVHTNDFAPIHLLRALKLGHASLATVFRPGRLTLQPILRENLESPVLRYQPITTAVVTDACLNTRWHHGAYTSAVLRESLGLDRVVTVYAELSRPDWLATVQSGRKQVQSRVCTPSFIRKALPGAYKARTKSAPNPLQNTLHGKRALLSDFIFCANLCSKFRLDYLTPFVAAFNASL